MQNNHVFELLTSLADETFRGDSPNFTHSWPHLQKFYDRVLSKTTFTTNSCKFFKGQHGCSRCSATITYTTQSTYALKSHYKKESNIYG